MIRIAVFLVADWCVPGGEIITLFKSNGYKYSKDFDDEILSNVYAKIELAEIWLPYGELVKYYYSEKRHYEKRANKLSEL